MPLRIIINISKKVPGPQEYSSTSASCSIESDLAHGQDPTAAAAELYQQAERAVDRQLGIKATSVPNSASNQPTRASNQPIALSAPMPNQPGRRAPATISPAQLRYLTQLLDRSPGARERIIVEQQVSSLQEISSRAASTIIDQLKTASA